MNNTNWDVKEAAEGLFEIKATIPSKNGDLVYAYLVDRANKTVTPTNDAGKAAFEELSRKAAKRPALRRAPRKAAPARAARPQARKSASKKISAPDSEYEYEYVDDDGSGQ